MARDSTSQAWARGGVVLAGTLMLIIGAYQIFLGITALVNNQFIVSTPNYYYTVDTTAWGWIHLGVGAIVALAGLFLFTGSTIAKIVGIALVSISALANFFLIPYYPLWSLLLIALDIFAIWAIASVRTDYGADAMVDERAMAGYGTGGQYGTSQGGMQSWRALARREPARWPALGPGQRQGGRPGPDGPAGHGRDRRAGPGTRGRRWPDHAARRQPTATSLSVAEPQNR